MQDRRKWQKGELFEFHKLYKLIKGKLLKPRANYLAHLV